MTTAMKGFPHQHLGKYRVDSALGVGGMGVVYRGYDEAIDRVVAIKVIHPHLRNGDAGAEIEQRFKIEARAAARCLHPNIVTVFDCGFADRVIYHGIAYDGVPYLVMEYVEGVELKALLKDQPQQRFPLTQALDIVLQLLEALGYAHAQGVVHRDIKPANVMVLNTGLIKLSDFGVAHLDSSDLTRAGHRVGTPAYMSPEGQRGEPVDGRGDLFSLALVLLELVCGERLNADRVAPDAIRLHLLRAAAGDPALTALEPVLQTALDTAPERRFATAAQLAEQLRRLAGDRQIGGDGQLAETVIQSQAFQSRPGAGPASAAPARPAQPFWPPELLQRIEDSLSQTLGPMARVLVRRQAGLCGDLDALLDTLAGHIASDDERRRFRRSIDADSVSRPSSGGGSQSSQLRSVLFAEEPAPARSAGADLNQVDVAGLARSLSEYMGPLARQMVNAELRRARSTEELYQRLAGKIPNEKEQAQFLAALRAQASAR